MGSFTESQIRSTERELADIAHRCSNYLQREQELNRKILDLRRDLSRAKSDDPFRRSKESAIANYEKDLARITKEHMDQERQRESKSKELDWLRRQLETERWHEAEEAKRKAGADKRAEDYRRKRAQQAEGEAEERARQKSNEERKAKTTTSSYQSSSSKAGFPKMLCYVFLGFVVLGLVFRLFNTSTLDDTVGQTTNISLSTLDTASMGMIDYMCLSVADIENLYGKDYTVDWLSSGGYWIVYSADSNCPYAFLYREKNQLDNDESPRPDDLICGVTSATVDTTVVGTAKIGMDHKYFASGIGQNYIAQIEPESDYILPAAWINFEAKGANESEKSNYSLMVLEDDGQIVYALLYKQPD